jgi:hypothetical protein
VFKISCYIPFKHRNNLAIMRSVFVLWGILTLTITATAGAQAPTNKNLKETHTDTLTSTLTKTPTRYPGVYEIAIEDPAGPFSIRIIEWDRSQAPELRLIPAKGALGQHERLAVHEATSVMARREHHPEVETIAAINADFFNRRGEPTNRMMSHGHWVLTHPERPARSVLSISPEGQLWIGTVSMTTELCSSVSAPRPSPPKKRPFRGQTSAATKNVKKTPPSNPDCRPLVWNRPPAHGQASVLNAWFSDTLRSNPHLQVYRILSADTVANPYSLQQTVKVNLEALPFSEPNLTSVPANQTYLAIRDSLGTPPADRLRSIQTTWIGSPFWPHHVIGGGPQLVRQGRIVVDSMAVVEEVLPSFLITRHPRTAIGWNADQSKWWMVVVDGRQAHSVGMGLYELTQLFIRLGAHEAMNLDGGGSSTLVVDGVIRNSPSDPTGERKVGNALLLIRNKTK